jgi:outer membrane protein assembly factor BamB
VDAETDTLIYPGENGILYMMKLNTNYDEAAGTLSISPDNVVKWRYKGTRTSTSSYWLGMEDSAVIYKGYMFITDNGGNFMCLNLNTLELVWVQDILDDSNSTPVLSIEDGHVYLYVSTSFHLGWRSSTTATVPIWKIDAENGEIIWQTDYECSSLDGVSGGVQSTIALGKHDLSDYIYVTVSRTGGSYNGVLSCISKSDGTINWEHEAYYAWSSPVCVYNSDGTGKVLYCSCAGKMYLLDGITGETNDTIELSDGSIESSPAVYKNIAVVGTRSCKIWGVELE